MFQKSWVRKLYVSHETFTIQKRLSWADLLFHVKHKKPTQIKINVSHETCISQIVYVSCETSISKGENHGSKDYKKANNKETDRQKRG